MKCDGADSEQARRIVIRVNVGKTCLVAVQIRGRKCPIASTYKINIRTPFWHLQSTCWSFWQHLNHLNTMTTSGSAANSTATMPVPYRQRLNGPNVKSTSGWTAVCSQFVVLLRGPGEQPGSARAEQHTNIRGAGHHRGGAMKPYNSPSLGFWTNSVSERAEVIGRPAAAAFIHAHEDPPPPPTHTAHSARNGNTFSDKV